MCGDRVNRTGCDHDPTCGSYCAFVSDEQRPKPSLLQLHVCHVDSILVRFKGCEKTFSSTSNVFNIIKPDNCGPKGIQCDLTPEISIIYEPLSSDPGFEVHTSCSLPLFVGQTYGINSETTVVGYCTNSKQGGDSCDLVDTNNLPSCGPAPSVELEPDASSPIQTPTPISARGSTSRGSPGGGRTNKQEPRWRQLFSGW